MASSLGFLRAFLKNPARNGSVLPSSRFLTRQMLRGVDFSQVRSVVELGPGEGVFTREIARRARPDATLIAIELNGEFARGLDAELGKRVRVENVSAEELDAVLSRHGVDVPDLIVCGLAFASMPAAPRDVIMALVAKYRAKGSAFRMFTYVPRRIRKLFPGHRFTKLGGTWLNVPPAVVLTVD